MSEENEYEDNHEYEEYFYVNNADINANKETNRIYRNWLILKEQRFFCIFCICFGTEKSNILCNNGLEIELHNRIAEKLRRHEQSTYHKLAHMKYLTGRYGNGKYDGEKVPLIFGMRQSETIIQNRHVAGCVIKAIIFLV